MKILQHPLYIIFINSNVEYYYKAIIFSILLNIGIIAYYVSRQPTTEWRVWLLVVVAFSGGERSK
jgi:TctA family transporter